MEPEWEAPDPLVMFTRPCEQAQSPWQGPSRLRVSLTACLLPLSQSPISSPFAPRLGGPGGELSGATTPCHQWTRPQQPPGMGPGSSRPESASPLCRLYQVLVGGTPKPFWEGLHRKVQPRPPQGWQPPIPAPRPPPEAQSNSLQAF